MSSFKVLVALFVAAAAEANWPEFLSTTETDNAKAHKLMQDLHQAVKQVLSPIESRHHAQMKRRRLQEFETCASDCDAMTSGDLPNDNNTVCAKPERCDFKIWEDACTADCSKTIIETLTICETKQYCVDNGKAGACPNTLNVIQGVETHGEPAACEACKEKSAKLEPILAMSGWGTMDMDTSKMTMGMTTEDNCPMTVAAAQCAYDNPEPCADLSKSSDASTMFFASLCDCPCGKKIAKFLWDYNTMMLTSCKKAIGDQFKTPLPGMAEMGPLLFQSGVLECLGCKENENKCMAAMNKWVLDANLKMTMMGLYAMKGKCDEVEGIATTKAPPAVSSTAAGSETVSSFAPRASPILGLFAAVFVAMKFA